MRNFLIGVACAFGMTALAATAVADPAGISVEQSWARASTPASKTAAAYMTIINNGGIAVRLVGASTPVAEAAQFHIENADNGVMRMRQVSAIDIKPGARFSFKPGGTHVMLIGVKEPLREGQMLPLTLDFEKAGKVQVDIPIGKPGAMSPHDMSNMGK
jgi:copper(I)-binding protein